MSRLVDADGCTVVPWVESYTGDPPRHCCFHGLGGMDFLDFLQIYADGRELAFEVE